MRPGKEVKKRANNRLSNMCVSVCLCCAYLIFGLFLSKLAFSQRFSSILWFPFSCSLLVDFDRFLSLTMDYLLLFLLLKILIQVFIFLRLYLSIYPICLSLFVPTVYVCQFFYFVADLSHFVLNHCVCFGLLLLGRFQKWN